MSSKMLPPGRSCLTVTSTGTVPSQQQCSLTERELLSEAGGETKIDILKRIVKSRKSFKTEMEAAGKTAAGSPEPNMKARQRKQRSPSARARSRSPSKAAAEALRAAKDRGFEPGQARRSTSPTKRGGTLGQSSAAHGFASALPASSLRAGDSGGPAGWYENPCNPWHSNHWNGASHRQRIMTSDGRGRWNGTAAANGGVAEVAALRSEVERLRNALAESGQMHRRGDRASDRTNPSVVEALQSHVDEVQQEVQELVGSFSLFASEMETIGFDLIKGFKRPKGNVSRSKVKGRA